MDKPETQTPLGDLSTDGTNTAKRIAASLEDALLSGTFSDGDRFPTERQLVAHFGVSRGTIRKALQKLENQHLLVRRIGSGTYVCNTQTANVGDISERTSPLELIDTRLALEPTICRLATINATGQDLRRLEEALNSLEQADNRESFSAADEEFHMALAMSTHNPLIATLFEITSKVRSHGQWSLMKDKILDQGTIDGYNEQHRAIYEALRNRDVEQAVATMRVHLRKARADLLGAQDD